MSADTVTNRSSPSTTLDYDADLAKQIEAIYATPDVTATRIAVFKAADPASGERALDVGCGPGYLTRELAMAVGPRGEVIGVDLSEPMLGMAAIRCADLSQVTLKKGDAGDLPIADEALDLACGQQIYCYVRELDRALSELRRVLKPGARAVILDTDFSGVVWETNDRERMKRVLDAYEAHVAWPDLPRILPLRLRKAGIRIARCEALPFVTLNCHPNTYVFGLARFIHQFVTKNAGFPKEEADAWLAEKSGAER